MALDLVLPRRSVNGASVSDVDTTDDETLAQFVRRRLGREALERMAQPMVGGIYTADPEQLSLRATMPRFLEMEREHRSLIRALRKQSGSPTVRKGPVGRGSNPAMKEGAGIDQGTSGARYSLFLSFDRGMQLLTDKLQERIINFQTQIPDDRSLQTTIRVNTSVKSLTPEREGDQTKWKIGTGQDEIIADAVCLAVPAYVSAYLLSDVDAQLASELDGISYASSATINLAYKREDVVHPLDGFGFVVPFIEKRTVMACTFSSVKFPGRAPHGHALLRAFVGGALQPQLFNLSRDQLLAAVRADLRDLLGIQRAPLFAEVSKWERSMPQYHVGHLERVKRIAARAASLPSLALAGNAYTGLGIPDCVRSGERAVDEILSAISY
jgi:oxygen-dependent protoporphyrinogen oxidase